ncbi:hypothetical protein AAZX31_12G183900 [Glycine max]
MRECEINMKVVNGVCDCRASLRGSEPLIWEANLQGESVCVHCEVLCFLWPKSFPLSQKMNEESYDDYVHSPTLYVKTHVLLLLVKNNKHILGRLIMTGLIVVSIQPKI